MWKFIIILIFWLSSIDIGYAAYASFQTYANQPQITCNLVTGVASVGGPCTAGTTCDGVTDNAPAFKAFNTWALANQGSNYQVVLNIPTGSICFFSSSQSYSGTSIGNIFGYGINNLIVDGNSGATLTGVGGAGFTLGSVGLCQAGLTAGNGCSARIQTVSAGAIQVTLTSASLSAGYISRFSVGKWIMIGGMDVQGLFQVGYGFPPNNTYFEWRQITNVNAGTGVITLGQALNNSYLSTWPNFNSGNSFEADAGGPATIWAVDDKWNARYEYRNLTLNQNGSINNNGRTIIYRNVTTTNTGGNCGPIPSQNETFAIYNSTWPCTMEVDKLVGSVVFNNTAFGRIDWQSNSIANFSMSNSTVTSMFGTARNNQITDTSFDFLRPGSGFGATQSIVCTRCAVVDYESPPQGGISINLTPPAFSMSGGIITWPADLANYAIQVMASPTDVPMFFWTTGYNSIGVFKATGISGGVWPAGDYQSATPGVTMSVGTPNLVVSSNLFSSGDVGKVIGVTGVLSANPAFILWSHIVSYTSPTQVTLYDNASANPGGAANLVQWGTSNVSVQTNQAGGFPSLATLGGNINFRSNQAYQFTCDACTGDIELTAMNIQNGATPLAPLNTFSKRTYTNQAAGANIGRMYGQGKLISLTIDVTTAYTGSGAGTLNPTGQFHNYAVKQSDWTQYDWLPVINVKQTGTRVITPSGVTCNGSAGGCSGDTNMTVPEAIWVQEGVSPSLTLAGSGGVNPTFSITLQTDQTP